MKKKSTTDNPNDITLDDMVHFFADAGARVLVFDEKGVSEIKATKVKSLDNNK